MPDPVRCLIVDDEPIARSIVRNYCNRLSDLHVVGECEDALQALQAIRTQQPALIFLDIDMPMLDGMSFLRSLKERPAVIITTAYQEHTLEGFELEVTDYLLKPFSFERFLTGVQRVLRHRNASAPEPIAAQEISKISLRAGGVLHFLAPEDILYCEARGNYTAVVLANETIETYQPLHRVLEQLPAVLFVQVHRSFVVNRKAIRRYENGSLYVGSQRVPVGRGYRGGLL